jgi:hypothetical protein
MSGSIVVEFGLACPLDMVEFVGIPWPQVKA